LATNLKVPFKLVAKFDSVPWVAAVAIAAGCAAPPDRAVVRASATSDPAQLPAPVRAALVPASAAPVVQITAGQRHACALHADATVSCWGANGTGQVADHPSARWSQSEGWGMGLATPVRFPLGDVLEVRAGEDRTCVRRADGVWCMGAPAGEPLHIAGTEDAVELTTGCARRAGGEVVCWRDLLHAAPVPELAGAIELVDAVGVTCGVKPDGALACVEPIDAGREPYDEAAVRRVVGGREPGAAQLAYADNFACVRYADGGVACWRSSWYTSGGYRTTPRDRVAGVTGAVDVGVGQSFACALGGDRAVRCWGDSPWASSDDGRPVPIAGLVADELAVGQWYACARTGGDVVCWGDGRVGQLGDGWQGVRAAPIDAPGITDAVDVEVGLGTSCARRRDGSVWCWGAGHGATPVEVTGLRGAVELAIGGDTCGRMAGDGAAGASVPMSGRRGPPSAAAGDGAAGASVPGGDVWCASGGRRTRRARGAIAIAAAVDHGAALDAGGGLTSWGQNAFGQHLTGTSTGARTTRHAVAFGDAVAVAAGDYRACVVRGAARRVWCAGRGALDLRSEPALREVVGAEGAVGLALTVRTGCALLGDGSVRCWGDGNHGVLGRDSVAATQVAVPIEGIADAVQVEGTRFAFCARRSDGAVLCWGDNAHGLIAEPWAAEWGSTPTVRLDDAIDVAVSTHACAVRRDGRVTCWGAADLGQLGTRSMEATAEPIRVRF
jgi:alpha-tubulin suppressor-like RCC1 family protein